jgi:spore maturation protein CgeB
MQEFKELNVLYIGRLNPIANSFRRFQTLSKICGVTGVNVDDYIYNSVFKRIHYHFNAGPGIVRLNTAVKKIIRTNRFDIVFVDNRPFLTAATLNYIREKQPAARLATILTDDPNGRFKSGWQLLRNTASLYDLHFVQRQVNISELQSWGAKRVALCYRSFDPEFHRPLELNAEDLKKYGCQVGFIGSYEDVREDYICFLIDNGIAVQVTGNDWEKGKHWEKIKPYYKGPSVYGDEYIKHLNGMQIALHFLRHSNRDEQDSRTFEIPACGAFMIAERSAVHQQLFKENEEVVFFTSKEELLQKVVFYIAHSEARRQIAQEGYIRCTTSGYDHLSRMCYLLSTTMQEHVESSVTL